MVDLAKIVERHMEPIEAEIRDLKAENERLREDNKDLEHKLQILEDARSASLDRYLRFRNELAYLCHRWEEAVENGTPDQWNMEGFVDAVVELNGHI